ncbi:MULTISPECIES: GtrA family protein [unclassified Agarivorans]|uniref:GtrA family protein n=1 Tax=unclassified Agarivorans TaxID=2636026 RepID=UPI003D7EAFE4
MSSRLIVLYILFAIAATWGNLTTQWLSDQIYKGPGQFYISLFTGTFVGLLLKYWLDKSYIFYFQTESRGDDIQKFILYSFMGVITTVLFWGTELLFALCFVDLEGAKYVGGIVGLAMGYLLKFYLDKRYVFVTAN